MGLSTLSSLFGILLTLTSTAWAQEPCRLQPPCATPAECLGQEALLVAAVQLGTAKKTTAQVYFIKSTKYPELGEAWVDPFGTTWGDVVTDSKGVPILMNRKQARSHCKSIHAELPEMHHFVRLRIQMGGKPMQSWSQYSEVSAGYQPEIFPHFGKTSVTPLWTDSDKFIEAKGTVQPFVFRPSDGRMQATEQSTTSLFQVRCIRHQRW